MPKAPVMLIVLDGFGINPNKKGNAIALANRPTFKKLEVANHSQILCSGESVGLPRDQMGNSEVGHTNIGAGRIVLQDFPRITKDIESGTLLKNPVLEKAAQIIKSRRSRLHFLGLVSDGGVHSHIDHLIGLIRYAKQKGIKEFFIHSFLDGRDTPYNSSPKYISQLEAVLQKEGVGKIATVSGRYFAMDRDKRWDRVKLAHDSITKAKGFKANSALEGIKKANERGETDEFIKPTVIDSSGVIRDNDVVIFFNFRADRARQLTTALTDNDFLEFNRSVHPKIGQYLTMTEYHKDFNHPIIFSPKHLTNVLGEVLSKHQIAQLRIAETEKYAHVTFFFNGGEEHVFPGEDRILIPSDRKVATYDQKPEMSARELTSTVIQNIQKGEFGFTVLNFANADMVGHSGNLKATIQAVEVLDECIGKILSRVLKKKGHLLITADHGNAEQMLDPKTGEPHTAHTTNPVPFYYVHPEQKKIGLNNGILADFTPTILDIMGIDKPKEVTRQSLIQGSI